MTNNEPELKMFAAIPVQLSFFYDTAAQTITFSSSSPDAFFGVPFEPGQAPPFLGAFEGKSREILSTEWQACVQMKENEVKHFTVPINHLECPLLFSFTVAKPGSSVTINPSVLLVSVIRMNSNDIRKKDTGTSSPLDEKYAEFIELAVHDLDSPLRKLSTLLERITGKYETITEQDTNSYFLRARACLSDMRSLIENLALLARLNNTARTILPCDLDSIVQTVKKDLDRIPGEKKIIIRQDPLPVVEGDAGQYRQLFRSLLDNAFKFNKKEMPAEVDIFSEVATGEEKQLHSLHTEKTYYKITVSDKGIGFRQEYAEKIFQPLVRLNGKSEYPGSGIGLALSRIIVENHGGIIYAQGDENMGARFILFLPLSPY